ncbi:hypothetical protein AYK24_09800 [Thermoplasmatales archaeon SG8-52-4]|nr:MAG: hypothetical protein AYK24_09800 [Thermoplasmatales archaeon SG8-52-4]
MEGWKALGFGSYQEYLLSDFWADKRNWIIKVRRGRCEKCGSTKKLQVHHLNYKNVGNEHGEDVVVLCKKCHLKEHGNKRGN